MIRKGFVHMAEAVVDRTGNDVVQRLATSMVKAQTGEIASLRDMLAARGG